MTCRYLLAPFLFLAKLSIRFIADAMGHLPIIQDNTYTTKMPADVDEEQFNPSSTSLPVPVPRGAGGDPSEVGFAYFALKCR